MANAPLYEAHYRPAARRFLESLSDEQAEEVRQIVRLIEIDPSINGQDKVLVDLPPAVVRVHVHPNWWLMYHVHQPGVVVIVAISPRFPRPNWAPPVGS